MDFKLGKEVRMRDNEKLINGFEIIVELKGLGYNRKQSGKTEDRLRLGQEVNFKKLRGWHFRIVSKPKNQNTLPHQLVFKNGAPDIKSIYPLLKAENNASQISYSSAILRDVQYKNLKEILLKKLFYDFIMPRHGLHFIIYFDKANQLFQHDFLNPKVYELYKKLISDEKLDQPVEILV